MENMSALTENLRATLKQTAAAQDDLDRKLTEQAAVLATAELRSRIMDVREAELRATLAAALAL